MGQDSKYNQASPVDVRAGVYSICNQSDGKMLIGSTNCFSRRYREHFYALRNDCHYNQHLQGAFNKYGEENFIFEVLEVCDESNLLGREQYYFDEILLAQEYLKGESEEFKKLGYNIEPLAGRKVNSTIPVAQVDLEGEIVKVFISIKEAAIANLGVEFYYGESESLSVNDGGIGACLRGNQLTAKGFLWFTFYDRKTLISDIEEKLKNVKLIEKIDLKTGERLGLYNTISEIEDSFGVKRGNSNLKMIYRHGEKEYKGYLWRYSNWVGVNKYYLACDPGKSGGVCLLRDDMGAIFNFVTPTAGGEIDTNRLINYLKAWSRHIRFAATEDVHSIFGVSAKSNFQFGRALGIIEGSLSSLGVAWLKVAPKEWQKIAWQGIPIVRKAPKTPGKQGSVDTKAMSLLAAKRLFPNESFIPTARSKNPHDGLVDAALIAYYLKISGR